MDSYKNKLDFHQIFKVWCIGPLWFRSVFTCWLPVICGDFKVCESEYNRPSDIPDIIFLLSLFYYVCDKKKSQTFFNNLEILPETLFWSQKKDV